MVLKIREVVKSNSSFALESDDAIAILSGNQEGYYLWVKSLSISKCMPTNSITHLYLFTREG